MYNRYMKKIRQRNQERRYSGGEVRTMKEGQVGKQVRVFRRIHGLLLPTPDFWVYIQSLIPLPQKTTRTSMPGCSSRPLVNTDRSEYAAFSREQTSWAHNIGNLATSGILHVALFHNAFHHLHSLLRLCVFCLDLTSTRTSYPNLSTILFAVQC